jgi:hypothetical protein
VTLLDSFLPIYARQIRFEEDLALYRLVLSAEELVPDYPDRDSGCQG